jgi:hypothetical protein
MTVGDQAQQAGRAWHAKRRVWHPPNDRAVALGLASLTTRHPILDAGNRAAGICMGGIQEARRHLQADAGIQP